MEIALGRFATWALRERLGPDATGGVEAALLYYAERARSHPAERTRPDLYPDLGKERGAAAFKIDPPPAVEGVLRREAERFDVPVEQIVSHAVLVYLADLDTASEAAQGTTPPALD